MPGTIRLKRETYTLPMPVRLRFGNAAQYIAALQEQNDLSSLEVVTGELPNPWLYIHGPVPSENSHRDAERRELFVRRRSVRLGPGFLRLGISDS